MITTRGRAILLNRLINNQNPPIQNIVLGTGKGRPSIHDVGLEELKIIKRAEPIININTPLIVFKAIFTAKDIKDCTEIGLTTQDDVLVCRDIFNNDEIPNVGHVTINYTLKLNNGFYTHNWFPLQDQKDVYMAVINERVTGVYVPEERTGYRRVYSVLALYATELAYYYDEINRKLYIHTNGIDPKIKNVEIKL